MAKVKPARNPHHLPINRSTHTDIAPAFGIPTAISASAIIRQNWDSPAIRYANIALGPAVAIPCPIRRKIPSPITAPTPKAQICQKPSFLGMSSILLSCFIQMLPVRIFKILMQHKFGNVQRHFFIHIIFLNPAH
ncbi:hypothetical protein D1872_206370 [compost metagenome]